MKTPIKGVNLGGWLLLERWITPGVFAGTSARNEYELARVAGKRRAIYQHQQTFMTEQDIAWLARVGIEAVRVPIGFWALQGDYGYQSTRERLDWLFKMAEKYQLKVLLCLHGAPGAQNNNDHSGSGRGKGTPGWYQAQNRRKTQLVLLELAERYGKKLWGIELMNEPFVPSPYHYIVLRRWVRAVTKQLRRALPKEVKIVISDAYMPRMWSGKVAGETLDIHHYQCFSPLHKRAQGVSEHLQLLQKSAKRYKTYAAQQPIIIGEWSATLPKKINGKQHGKVYCQAQLQAWSVAEAWFFWSYKTEQSGSWNFRELYKRGYFDGYLL